MRCRRVTHHFLVKHKKEKLPKKGLFYFIIALRSSSGVLMGMMLNFSTSTLRMLGCYEGWQAGSDADVFYAQGEQ